MNLRAFIKPFNNNHSIKEVVVTIFLSSPIASPSSFETLLKNEFKDKFDTFEKVDAWKLSLNQMEELPKPLYSKDDNIGFRFKRSDGKNIKRVLQGINEESRTFLSYHTLDYVRWTPFFEEFLDSINTIAQQHQEFQIEAISLHYIDEFIWIAEGSSNLRLIFSEKSDYIPKSFLDNLFPRLDLFFTADRSDESGGTIYYDRINIFVQPTIQPTITISHTVTHQLNEPINIKDLFSRQLFKDLIENAHYHNKQLLVNLLSTETAKLINLN